MRTKKAFMKRVAAGWRSSTTDSDRCSSRRRLFMRYKLPALLISALLAQVAVAADTDPCTRFAWDVSHELAVMKQTPLTITAAGKPGKDLPQLQLDKLY